MNSILNVLNIFTVFFVVYTDLLSTPEDVTVIKGGTVRFNCSTTLEFVDWQFIKPDSDDAPVVINYQQNIVDSYKSRHSLITDEPGVFDLQIDRTVLSDAGTYICVDNGGFGPQKATAKLTVLGM